MTVRRAPRSPALLVLALFLLGSLGFGLVGCGPVQAEAPRVEPNRKLVDMVSERPGPSRLVLPSGKEKAQLGDNEQSIAQKFPKPAGAYSVKELPPGVPPIYTVTGWETSTEGFGVLSNRGQVELVMRQFEKMSPEAFASYLQSVVASNSGFAIREFSEKGIDYWIAEDGRDRLVLSRMLGAQQLSTVCLTLCHNLFSEHLNLIPNAAVRSAEAPVANPGAPSSTPPPGAPIAPDVPNPPGVGP